MRKPGLLLILIFLINAQVIYSQAVSRYNTFSYGVNEGLLQTTIKDIEIDNNNFCWISFPNGIQKFDGNKFTNVPVQSGLPDDKFIDMFRCANGDLLLSHSQGISRYNIRSDNFTQIYKGKSPLQWPLSFIGEEQGLIYCSDEKGVIIAFSAEGFKMINEFSTGLETSFLDVNKRSRFSDNIIDHKAVLKIDSLLYLLDLRNKKIINQVVVPGIRNATMLRLKSTFEVLYFDPRNSNKLNSLDFNSGHESSWIVKGKETGYFHWRGIFPWHEKKLMYLNNRLYESDSVFKELKSELVNFQNQPVAGEVSIAKIAEDNFGNLYIQTVNGGIRKVLRHNYPLKYFGTNESKINNILTVLPDKINNRILAGGNGGLFIFDTLQQLVKHIKSAGQNVDIIPNGIFKAGDGDYVFFVTGSAIAYRLSRDLSVITPIHISTTLPAENNRVEFFGNPLYNDGKYGIFQGQGKLYRIDFGKNKITEHIFSSAYIMGGIWHNNTIISHGKDEFIFLDGNTFKELKRIPFSEGAGVRCFTTDDQGSLYAGTNKGVFKVDTNGIILRVWDKTAGLPDECIYAMRFDSQGALWCSTNKGLVRIDKNNNLFIISKQDGLQENEFNTNVAAVAEDGEFYFGGINGVSSFYPLHVKSMDDKITVLLTGINANNKIIYNNGANELKELVLPYGENSLSFDFVAMGSNNPGQYIYQYRMKGLDKEWIPNDHLQTIRYSLSPGKYHLQLYASRQFNKDAVPMKELTVIIKPPFWQSWWFYVLLFVGTMSLLAFGINFYNKNRYAKKLHALESENKIKQERERISRDLHDNLGAYSNAILYNSSLLEEEKNEHKKKLLVKELKFASKDIINTLRETIWALNKETHSAEDCLLRVRNFTQTMNRFYTNIQMSVSGAAPPDRTFHNTDAFNLVRIIQEAVSNSIKHSGCRSVIVSSNVESSKWELIIHDDGSGFNVQEAENSEHGNGLGNMQQRAAESGFLFKMESIEKSGTTITLVV